MALNYKLYQSKREGKTNGKWYARAAHDGTMTTDDLASIMQANCTVKRSDILAVMSELVETMTIQLQNSKRVKIGGLGTFKLGISTKPAAEAKDFSVAQNVKGTHVLFQPEVKIDAKHNRLQSLISGVKLKEALPYEVDKGEAQPSEPQA